MRSLSRRHFLCCGISGLLTGFSAGCGTIMHPERKGQNAGPLDWGVVALDSLGLLCFFVPGVIAFAVDFSNGTIYLPSDEYGATNQKGKNSKLNSVSIPSGQISQHEIGRVISKHTGRDIKLVHGEYETKPIKSIDEFWTTTDQMTARS